MKTKFYTPVFSLTLLLSAALLFSVQPMFSKMILPLLGGTPQVWNTAMLFFQVMLLGGYAYAHGTTQFLGIRSQAILHIVLLLLFFGVLPFAIPEGWIPPNDKDPTLWQLSLMLMTVGGPFFVLAASAPMLQRWFTNTDHPDAKDPYFLYGASNLGSMAALLAYPTVIEPMLTLNRQADVWTGGYVLLIVLALICAVLIWTHSTKKVVNEKAAKDTHITWGLRGKWVLLALIPSSLMLGVTTYITTDIGAVPLLWIMPLALYVGTFIIAFSRKPIISKQHVTFIHGILMVALIVQLMTGIAGTVAIALIGFHLLLFFFAALSCHMELTACRPSARHLTEFYLLMSLGGAIGGILNAIIAPNYLVIPLEYAMALAASCFLRNASSKEPFRKKFTSESGFALIIITFTLMAFNIEQTLFPFIHGALVFAVVMCAPAIINKRWVFAITIAACLFLYPPGYTWGRFLAEDVIHFNRNFFGASRVVDSKLGQRTLIHGTTNHGTQATIEKYRLTPLSYYGPNSVFQDAFSYLDKNSGPQEVAVAGLGIGVTACYKKRGRHFDFFEIDKDIADIAENTEFFTFLSDCGSPYDITLGDARLTLKDKPDAHYDMIVVDVFSSDNIPIHLLTIEAIEMYLTKLKPSGVLFFHISNNYLDLEPVLSEAAEYLKIPAYAKFSMDGTIKGTSLGYYQAHGVVLTKSREAEKILKLKQWSVLKKREGVHLWTDQYSNIVRVFGNQIGHERMKESYKAQKNK